MLHVLRLWLLMRTYPGKWKGVLKLRQTTGARVWKPSRRSSTPCPLDNTPITPTCHLPNVAKARLQASLAAVE